jgi:hypothetical protein
MQQMQQQLLELAVQAGQGAPGSCRCSDSSSSSSSSLMGGNKCLLLLMKVGATS